MIDPDAEQKIIVVEGQHDRRKAASRPEAFRPDQVSGQRRQEQVKRPGGRERRAPQISSRWRAPGCSPSSASASLD
jgi:hypothetical protein